jgi:hypothetical protein
MKYETFEDFTELPPLIATEDAGVIALKAQHALTPFDDVISISSGTIIGGQTRPLNYLFVGDEMAGVVSDKMLEMFGYKA